jgi:universal stress protein E
LLYLLQTKKTEKMKLLQKILVPVDFGQASLRALDAAIMLSKYFLSEIILLHVAPAEKVSEDTEKIIVESIRSKMKLLLDIAENEHVKAVSVIIEKGVPMERIIHIAEIKDIDLIVIGEGNNSDNDLFKLGTTAEKLMLGNQIPLYVVKNATVTPVKKILCPVDFSDASKRALTNAIFLSNRFKARLTILNVFTPLQVYSYWINVDNEEENKLQTKRQREEFNDFLKDFHLNEKIHKVKMINGEPDEQILIEIRNEGIDLLVMGTTGKSGISRILLGSVTEKVTRELPCNFIINNESGISDEIFESNLKTIESLILTGRTHFENDEFDKAIEKYNHVLSHHPDNIPSLLGLVKCYNKTGNKQKAEFYTGYIQKIIDRSWDNDDIVLLGTL